MIACLDDSYIDSIFSKFGRNIVKINLSNNGLRCVKKIERFSETLEILDISKNEITDVQPLSLLFSIRQLDLSDNFISSISPLSSLVSLESLNLRNNSLRKVEDLKTLASLRLLTDLFVHGNPLCRVQEWNTIVLTQLPYIQRLDSYLRSDVLRTVSAASSAASASAVAMDSMVSTARSFPNEATQFDYSGDLISSLKSEIGSLQLQIEAFEAAFALQERALAISPLTDSPPLAQMSTATNRGSAVDESDNTCFPYQRLLQLWRQKALSSMITRAAAEKSLAAASAAFKHERAVLGQRALEAEGASGSWKSRHTALLEKHDSLSSRYNELEDALQRECLHRSEAERRDAQHIRNLQQMHGFLRSYRSVMDEQWIRSQVSSMKAVDRIEGMERRLVAATERVSMAAALIAQKEVVLRNTAAALEADRRLLRSSIGQAEVDRCQSLALEGDSGSGSGTDSGIRVCLSMTELKPEAESLLRTLFRLLDPDDTGLVSAALLAESLGVGVFQEGAAEEESQLGVWVRASLGPWLWHCLSTNLTEVIAMGATAANAVSASSYGAGPSLTWGEMLLLLVPSKSSAGRVCPEDLHALYRDKLWGDEQWAMVPLQLPASATSRPASSPGYAGSAGSKEAFDVRSVELEKEVRRLAVERSYLLSRVQEMVRTLDRRVEAVSAHFEDELRQGRQREHRLKAQLGDLKGTVADLQERLSASSGAVDATREQLGGRIRIVEQERDKLVEELGLSRSDQMHKYEAIIAEEKTRFHRLEAEHNLLQREVSKKEVKLKGLQRDSVRMQASLAAPSEENLKLKEAYSKVAEQLSEATGAVADLERRLREERTEHGLEQARLTARIESLEKALLLAAGDEQSGGSSGEAAEAVSATAASASASASANGGVDRAILKQLEVLRALPRDVTSSAAVSDTAVASVDPLAPGSGSGPAAHASTNIYAAHLSKLLRCTDELIRPY